MTFYRKEDKHFHPSEGYDPHQIYYIECILFVLNVLYLINAFIIYANHNKLLS